MFLVAKDEKRMSQGVASVDIHDVRGYVRAVLQMVRDAHKYATKLSGNLCGSMVSSGIVTTNNQQSP